MDKHNLLYPPIDVKNIMDKDEILLINGMKNGNLHFGFLNARFKFVSDFMEVPVKEFSKFLDSPACRNLKAVLFNLSDLDNFSKLTNLEIRQMVYEEVRKRNRHVCLFHSSVVVILTSLFTAKIDSKPGDIILHIVFDRGASVSELRRMPEGYSSIVDRNIKRLNKSINDLTTEILGTSDPKYVFVFGPQNNDLNDLVKSLKSSIVPSKNVISIDSDGDILDDTRQVYKAIYDPECNPLIPFCIDNFVVTNETNFTDPDQAVITIEEYEDLPFEKIQIVPKSKMPYYIAFLDTISESYKPAGKAQQSKAQGGHRIKLALVVDRNTLPFLYQEPFIIPEIQILPQKLASSKADLNVPVIGFFDNSSVICVRDENGYRFLNEWNNLYGNDLYLSFEQEKPTMITDLNKVKNKDPFIVYDLVKVLSMPVDDLKADPKWGFKVTSDDENLVLLQFETFLGTRKSSTPIFLMALFLKHHIKAIKKETGKKPKEIGFCLFNEFTNEEKKRIHNGLEAACELLKIGFVVVTNV